MVASFSWRYSPRRTPRETSAKGQGFGHSYGRLRETTRRKVREIEQEIERKGIALGINWDDDAQVRSLAREALDHATGKSRYLPRAPLIRN